MVYNDIRNYEVSIWTLQNSFLSVLKGSNVENKGQIQEPKMNIKDDGTLEFSFSLPMYLCEGPNRKENPIWYNAINGNLMVNLRKIKVIFNKNTKDEGIFEFLITVVTERHEDDELYCDVECEGLAFHELGKIGYKISLSQDDYIAEWGDWANESYIDDNEHSLREPHNNINYWCDKVFKDTNWSYSIQMDWSAYDGIMITKDANGNLVLSEAAASNEIIPYAQLTSQEKALINQMREERGLRRNDKIYEDEYVSSWISNGDVLSPRTLEQKREKYRLFDESESNIYNLTQTIAETFEVFCKYVYSYDENYHIVGREVVFYNNFLNEAQGELSITYPYATNHIEREMDGTEIVTKMYVKTLDDSSTESGLATIMDTAANRSGEDYILNFDYLYSIGTISQEQYDEIPKYEAKLHDINNQIQPLQSKLIGLEEELTDLSATETILKDSVSLDNERISANDDLLNSLTDGTGIISVTALRPDICYVIENTSKPGTYCITIRQKGIIKESIHIYKTYNTTSGELSNEITEYLCEVSEDNNLTGKIINMEKPVDSAMVYVIYDYRPQLYYENIKQSWINKRNKDLTQLSNARDRLETIDGKKDSNGNRITDGLIQTIEKKIDDLLAEKEAIIKDFNKMMGAALREGNWKPEDDYANYGDKHTNYLTLNHSAAFTDELVSIGWDNEPFDDEQKNYYEEGVDQKKVYYPCIDLTNYMDRFTDAWLNSRGDSEYLTVDSLDFIFQDMPNLAIENPSFFRYFPVNSQCVFTFIRKKYTTGKIIPVLMITGVDALTADVDITSADARARIGYLQTSVSAEGVNYAVNAIVDTDEIVWMPEDELEDYEIVYPRIRVNSMNLKSSNDELSLYLNNSLMPNYEGYYILNRTDEEEEQYYSRYYITIKPNYIFKTGSIAGQYVLNYTISNTALIMYLDAIDVLKENAYPKVSYTIDPTLMNDSFTRTAYNSLSRIVHINDADLKFENIRGYISELDLDLDRPWEDSIEIKNYKTKFEDLFSNIVAQTEEMKKNSQAIGRAASLFTSSGVLKSDVIQATLERQNLDYAFNQGTLTINEANGIWGTSDDGVVAYRGGGIFTATEKDEAGDWIWNTGILPSGINADLITTGQLDTNLIRIYAGNDLKFQMNGDGLFAYKSWLQDKPQAGSVADTIRAGEYVNNDLKPGEYVVHNSDGLFLVAKKDTPVLNEDATDYVNLEEDVNRVAISWDGLTIRNWNNEPVFYADTKGDLILSGTIYATDGEFSGDVHARSLTIGGDNIPADEYIGGKISEATDGIQEELENYVRITQESFEAHFSDVVREEIVPDAVAEATSGVISDVRDELSSFGEATRQELEYIQGQIDGNITTWFYEGPPSFTTPPTNEWFDGDVLSTEKANEHLGDLYYDKENGYCYRWMQEGNGGSYTWTLIKDNEITKALQDAKDAKDTADSKRRVFGGSNPPRPPYDEGDLWVQGEHGDILYCQNPRPKDDLEYAAAEVAGTEALNELLHKDWALASKYNDDSALLEFRNEYNQKLDTLQAQVDSHIATYFGSVDPADSWPTNNEREKHIGDLWFCENSDDPEYKSGYLYRYDMDGSSYKWTEIDSAPSETVLNLLKNTNRVYVHSPQNDAAQYKVGDLWIVDKNDLYLFSKDSGIAEGDILVCQQDFKEYDVDKQWVSDWTKAVKTVDTSAIQDALADIQEQLDSKVQTWYSEDDPSNAWKTNIEESNKHDGDLWYNTADSNTYRWQYSETPDDNGNYGSWEVITSEIPPELYDTLDGKSSIFVNKPGEPKTPPTPPYQVGDLWFQGTDEPILTCITSRTKDEEYNEQDWVELNKYTKELNDFVNNTFTVDMAALRKQIDGKLETFIQASDPSDKWNPTQKLDHIGDMWKCTDEANTDKYNKYFSWNGTEWIEMDKEPPKAYFDSIDGKAQIFVTTPKGPYHTGDLWITNAADENDFPEAQPPITADEILTCVADNRTSGSYNKTDWQRRVKYTDDSSLGEVQEKIVTFESELSATKEKLVSDYTTKEEFNGQVSAFNSRFEQSSHEISAVVSSIENIPKDTHQEFCITNDNITPPGEDAHWQLEYPERTNPNEYVWFRLVFELDDTGEKTRAGEPICLTGNNGTGIVGVSIDYQRSVEGDVAPEGMWYGSIYQANADKPPAEYPYIWTRTVTEYNNLPTSYSYTVTCDGKNVYSATIDYGTSDDVGSKPTEWVSDIADLEEIKKYVWTRTVFHYNDGTFSDPIYGVSVRGEQGEPGTSLIGFENMYARSNDGENPPEDENAWKKTIELANQDKNKLEYIYLWHRLTMEYSDGTKVPSFTVARDGTNGYNTAQLLLYRRSKTTLKDSDTPSGLTYNFETREITGNLGEWAPNPPDGDDPLYVISNFVSSLENEVVITSDWSDPVILVQNGTGYNSAPLFLYQRAATLEDLVMPEDLIYNFEQADFTNDAAALHGWTQTVPALTEDNQPCYMIQAVASSLDMEANIPQDRWSSPIQFIEDGEKGFNSAVIYLYARSKTEITEKPSDSDWPVTSEGDVGYNFKTKEFTNVPTGWTSKIPSATLDPIYVMSAIASSQSDEDNIPKNEWSEPSLFAKSGMNCATVFLYKRTDATGAEIMPSVIMEYSFVTGKFINEPDNGWSVTVPEVDKDRNPCYMIQATAMSSEDVDKIDTDEWTEPVIYVQDGISAYNNAHLFLYTRSAENPPEKVLTDMIYHIDTGILDVPESSPWKLSIPNTTTDPVWLTTATVATLETSNYTVQADDWAAPVLFVQDGVSYSSAPLFLYQRSETKPIPPTLVTYYFSDARYEGELGSWSTTIPDRDENAFPCYVTQAVATAQDKESVEVTNWADPVLYSEDGFHTATVTLYKRSATTLTEVGIKNDLSYDFTTGKIISDENLMNGWSMDIPALNSNYTIYMTKAITASQATKDIIGYNEWSTPVTLSGPNNAIVYLYQRAASVGGLSAIPLEVTYSFADKKIISDTGNWSQTPPDMTEEHLPCYIIQATVLSNTTTDTVAREEWSNPVILAKDGIDGISAYNNATITLYTRSQSTPGKISVNMMYNFSTGELTGIPSNWSRNVPSGTDPIYVTTITITNINSSFEIPAGNWPEPVLLAKNGTNGSPGSSGYSNAAVFMYRRYRADAIPPTPSSLTYYFSSGQISGTTTALNGWSSSVPSKTEDNLPCYVTQSVASSRSTSASVYSWSTPVIYVEDGIDGKDGSDGYNTAILNLYTRAESSPSKPSSMKVSYTFSTRTFSGVPSGWYSNLPEAEKNKIGSIYIMSAIARSQTDIDDNIPTEEWSDPVLFSGPLSATVSLYKRSNGKPAGGSERPIGPITYNFYNQAIVDGTQYLNNWEFDIPEGEDPCYRIQATALSDGNEDIIEATEWGQPALFSKNGENGKDGRSINKIVNFYKVNNSSESADEGDNSWIRDDEPDAKIPQITKDNKYLWNYEIIYDDRNAPISTSPPILLSTWSEDGKNGKSIKSILEYFNFNTDKDNPPKSTAYSPAAGVGTGWVERDEFTPPEPENDIIKYVWNIEVIIYDDDENSYTQLSPHISSIITKGKDGESGTTYYTWIRYSKYPDGTSPTTDPTGCEYIGIGYNKTSPTSTSNKSDYTWSKFIGPQGAKGESGYTWIKYAKEVTYSSDGSVIVSQMYDDPKDMSYIGLAFNKTAETESSSPNDYQWSLIKGSDGIRGGKTLVIKHEPAASSSSSTYKYTISASDVKTDTGIDVIIGDTLQYKTYLYPVIGISNDTVQLGERTQMEGKDGKDGIDAGPDPNRPFKGFKYYAFKERYDDIVTNKKEDMTWTKIDEYIESKSPTYDFFTDQEAMNRGIFTTPAGYNPTKHFLWSMDVFKYTDLSYTNYTGEEVRKTPIRDIEQTNIASLVIDPDKITTEAVNFKNGLMNARSKMEQTAEKMSWIVESGDSASNMELTDEALNVIAKNIDLSANDTITFTITDGMKSDITSNCVKTTDRTAINLDTYMKIKDDGVYIGKSVGETDAQTQAVINANNSAFEIRNGDIITSSLGINRVEIAGLIFYLSSSGSIAVDYKR